MYISDGLAATPVSELDLGRYVVVGLADPVATVVETMNDVGRSCAVVVDDAKPVGIFTQRDVLMRVLGRPSTWQQPVADQMSTPLRSLEGRASAQEALDVMTHWWVRSIPIVEAGELAGVASYYDLMRLIARLVDDRIGESDREPDAAHALTMIDFTGLAIHPPVTVPLSETIDVAVHHMRARAVGSVLVVDDREQLAGVLTEFDLQTKVGCAEPDLTRIAVKDIMTEAPVAVPARSPIAGALQAMAEHEFSHVPLLGESGRPVGVASFRDIAGFLESSLQTLV